VVDETIKSYVLFTSNTFRFTNLSMLFIHIVVDGKWNPIIQNPQRYVYSTYIHTYHSRFIPEGVAEISQIHRDAHVLPKDLGMKNTADATGGKPIAVRFQSISGVSAINPLVAFDNIHGRKREVLIYSSVPDTTRDYIYSI
jgi:hypothetical protein